MHALIPIHNRWSLLSTTSQHASERYYTGNRDRDGDAVQKGEYPLSYVVKYRNLPHIPLIVLPRPAFVRDLAFIALAALFTPGM